MNPARSVGRKGTTAARATTATAAAFGIARRAVLVSVTGIAPGVVTDSLIVTRSAPPLGKMPVEEANEGALLRRMRVRARRRVVAGGQADRLTFVDVACDDEGMHVRRAA